MAKDTEKLIRQLSLISYLMAERRTVTASEIRRDVEGYSDMTEDAFARRFYADRAELESLGIQLAVDRPTDGLSEQENYSLAPEAFHLPAIEFTDAELAALQTSLSLLDGEFAYAEPLRLALQQISWGRPSPLDAPEQRTVALGITAAAHGAELSQRLAKIDTAIYRRKRIEFEYHSMQRDETGMRRVDPYCLLYEGGQFYLVGYAHERDDIRVFRLSRIIGKVGYSTKAEHDFQRPEDFDSRQYANKITWQLGELEHTAEILVTPAIAWQVERHFARYGEMLDAPEGEEGRVFRTRYALSRPLISWVFGFGREARVLSPPALVEEARRRLETVVELHRGEPLLDAEEALAAQRERDAAAARAAGFGEAPAGDGLPVAGDGTGADPAGGGFGTRPTAPGTTRGGGRRAAALMIDNESSYAAADDDDQHRRGRSRRRPRRRAGDAAIRPERFARLVTLASILIRAARAGERLRVRELCKRLNITEMELREDVGVLNVVNFGGGSYVLYAEVLPNGEIEVDTEPYSDTFDRPARLLPIEAKALVAAIDLIGEHLPEGTLSSARQKIVDALGSDPVREGLHIPAAGADDSDWAQIAQRAIAGRRLLRLEYYKPHENEHSTRTVEPYGLFNAKDGWYLSTWDVDKDARRSFRLDRVKSAELLEATFEPRPFDLDAEIEGWPRTGEVQGSRVAHVWIHPEQARWTREKHTVLAELDDGAIVVELTYKGEDYLVQAVLKEAGDAAVLEPAEARAAVLAAAEQLYAAPTGSISTP